MSKVWFITGATRGLGAAIAASAWAAGDRVVVTGRDVRTLAALAAPHGERGLAVGLDVTREAEAMAAAELAVARYGRIDVLVNNAGYGQLGLFEQIGADEIERQFRTNVYGLMHVTRAVLPVMRRQRAGHVFNVASIGGFTGFEAASVYCAAKFAVEGYSESLAPEVAPFGIRVTIVEPGFFRTDFLDDRSVRYGAAPIADYVDAAAAARSLYDGYNHRQLGDPARLGSALVTLVGMAEPPLHFVAGSDALEFARTAFDRRRAEIEAHAALSVTTDGQR